MVSKVLVRVWLLHMALAKVEYGIGSTQDSSCICGRVVTSD